jgi:hypothetical protein
MHPSDDASKFLFGADTVGHMLLANCSAPMCPESISDYFQSDPNSRYPQSAYQAALDTYGRTARFIFVCDAFVTQCAGSRCFKKVGLIATSSRTLP